MKIQIRQSVFETNSSSTHVLCLCSEEDFIKFKNGKLLLDSDILIDIDDPEVLELKEKYPDSWKDDFKTWDDYNNIGYETFYRQFISKSGDKLVAFGYFGYDG